MPQTQLAWSCWLRSDLRPAQQYAPWNHHCFLRHIRGGCVERL